MANQVVIVAGGSLSAHAIKKLCHLSLANAKQIFIIGCDRGAQYLLDAGIAPDLVVGDLDSISSAALQKIFSLQVPIESFPTEKDLSDLELAVQAAADRGYTEIVITCALGDRADFTLANCALLLRTEYASLNISIIEDFEEISPVRQGRPINVTGQTNRTFSVIPYGTHNIISIRGAKWNLQNEPVALGISRLVSNVVAEEILEVEFSLGCGLLILHTGSPNAVDGSVR